MIQYHCYPISPTEDGRIDFSALHQMAGGQEVTEEEPRPESRVKITEIDSSKMVGSHGTLLVYVCLACPIAPLANFCGF